MNDKSKLYFKILLFGIIIYTFVKYLNNNHHKHAINTISSIKISQEEYNLNKKIDYNNIDKNDVNLNQNNKLGINQNWKSK